MFTTEAYQTAAVQIMLEEVNRVARVLNLPEKRPLTSKDRTEVLIQPPFMSEHAGQFGCIRSQRFSYCASIDSRLSYITRVFGYEADGREADLSALRKKYTLPKSLINTNAAYRLATQWLTAAAIDLAALEHDCRVQVSLWDLGDRFVPLYWVRWVDTVPKRVVTGVISPAAETESVAFVELFEPDHSLRSLRVNAPGSSCRTRLRVPRASDLLLRTSDQNARKVWFTTEKYKSAALAAMLTEVNFQVQQLGLPVETAICSADLSEAIIETPCVADQEGHFATIRTKDYVFAANAGNKLSYISKSARFRNETRYLNLLASRYCLPRNQWNDEAAYESATRWMARASLDVAALERDCARTVSTQDFGDQFLPLYHFEWKHGEDVAATVEVLEPEHSLEKLWVENPDYILRKPLSVRNREQLLSPPADIAHPSGIKGAGD